MSLHFDVTGDNSNFLRKLEETKRGVSETAKFMESQGKKIDSSFNSVSFGDALKKQIHDGAQSVNGLTAQIIKQKAVIKDVEQDVRALGAAYRKAGAGTQKGNALFADYGRAKGALQEEKNALFGLQTEQAQARLSVRKLKDEYSLYQKEGQNVVDSNNNMALSFKKTLAVIGGTAAIKKFVSDVLRIRGEFQQLDVAFTTLLQSKEKANSLMAQMVQTAAKTPFNLTELATGARQLVAYGFQAEEINGTLIRLGNIASGLGLPLERLTYLYGTTMTQGRLYARDLMQFTTSGIPMLQGLADMYGVSTAKVNEMVSAGKIGFPEVQKVVENLTNEGGKFFNLMEEQSKTITGKISNLGDAMDGMFNSIGQANEGVINDSIDGLKYLVENYEQVGRILLGLVATYGTYRAALILTNTYGIYDVATKNLQFAATMKNIVATNAMIVKQALLNSTMLANPFVLVTTLVVGAAAAMWALHDGTSEAEKAQERFNKRKEEASKIEQEHKQKVDELLNSARDESISTLTRQKSLEELRKEYPKIFAEYDIEKLKLAEILEIKKKINAEDGRKTTVKQKTDLVLIEKEIKKYEGLVKALNSGDEGYLKKLKQLRLDRDNLLKDKGTGISELFVSNLKNIDEKELKHYADVLQKKISGKGKDGAIKIKLPIDAKGTLSDEAIFDVKTIKALVDSVNSETKRKSDIQKADKKIGKGWLKDKKDDYDQAIKDLKAYENSKKELTKEEYEKGFNDKKEKVEITKKSYEDAGGQTSSQQKKESSSADKLREQQEKLALLMDKQASEQIRSEQDLQNQVAQVKIDSMQEGSTKTLAQMQLNHKKEMQQFEREKEDKLRKAIEDARAIFDAEEDAKKAKNPKHVNGTFDASGVKLSDSDTKLYSEQKGSLDEKQKKEIEDHYKSLRDSYQDYTDQRIAIEEKYNDDIATLQESRKKYEKEGNTEKVQQTDRAIAQATKNRGKELMGKDYDKLKESPEYVRAFENLKETSSETLNSLLAQLENAKGTAAQVLSPDQLREYTTTIQEIMDELDSRNPWQALSDKKQELANAEEELAQAQVELENARQTAETVKGGGKVEYTTTKFNQKTGKIDSTKAYLTEAQALDNVKTKTDKYNKSKDNVTKTNSKVKKSEEEVKAEIDELSKSISDVGAAIGGPAGEIISLIGDIGTFTMTAMSGVQAAADTSATAISTVEKASVILAIISAAFQIAMKIASLFNNDDEYQKEIEKLQGRIEQLQWELDNADAIRLQNNTFQALQKVKEVYAETTEEVLKLHAANDKYLNAFDRMFLRARSSNEILQKSAEKLALAYANIDYTADKALGTEKFSGAKEQLTNIAQQQLLIQEQIRNEDSKKKTDHGKIEDWERQIQELGEQANAIINEIVEGIIGGSAADIAAELGDAFIEAFQSGENAAEAWGDKVDDIVANVLKRMLVSKYLEEPLGEIFDKYKTMWYKDGEFAGIDAIMESMGGFSNDLNAVGSEFQTIWDALPDNIKSMFAPDEKSTSQDSTKGMSQSMDQDTGNELNGRFTAFQISNEGIRTSTEEIKNSMLSMLVSMNLMSVSVSNNGIVLVEIRNLMISSNSYLEDIAKYTKVLMLFGDKLDSIANNTKGLTSR